MPKQVIMCGGPADGVWVAVDEAAENWRVATMPPSTPVRVKTTQEILQEPVPVPVFTTYAIFLEDLFGRPIYVGVPLEYPGDWSVLVMKAVLQRDVAQHLGAFR